MSIIRLEVTDTFGGEPNYCWVYRSEIPFAGKEPSRRKILRELRDLAGWPVSVRMTVHDFGNQWEVRPHGLLQVAFVDFDWADSFEDDPGWVSECCKACSACGE
jgi:hypothetical protein